MNRIIFLFILVCLTIIWAFHPTFANQDYSNSANVESVTTFFSCTTANIPQGAKDTVCQEVGDTGAITAIRFIARPGENDIDAGREMAFFTFPPPFANQPVNQQNGAPPDNPCAQATATTNCTPFTDGNGNTGPIKMQITASQVVRKYKLVPVLEGLTVPYNYLNYDAKVPRCTPADYCYNGCDNNDITADTCNPGAGGNTKTSFYACCQVQNDYEPTDCCSNCGPKNRVGSIYSQANSFYDFGDNCGEHDEQLTNNFGSDYGQLTSNSPDCRSCSKIYNLIDKKEVANWGSFYEENPGSHARKCPDPLYLTQPNPNAYPRLMPDICPIAVSHSDAYPVTEGNRNSMNHGNPDAYEMEPYYYWCQAQCVGTQSYTPKTVLVAIAATPSNVCGDALGDEPINPESGKYVLSERGNGGIRLLDHNMMWEAAYECQLQGESCPGLVWAKSLDESGFPCCNSTFQTDGEFVDQCGVYGDSNPGRNCGGMAQEQVRNAASYYTAACDAMESAEIAQCGQQCGLAAQNEAANDLSWTCPGWPYDYIRPKNNKSPLTLGEAGGNDGVATAKCSGECQADPFIRWSDTGSNNKNCKGDSCRVNYQSITTQKAAIGMAGASCRVYQVVPEPIVDISIVVTYTAPDGTVVESPLATDGSYPSQATIQLQNVSFTTRINELFVRGGAGPQIPGYIVICGTDEPRVDSTNCHADFTNTRGPDIREYNPYDPEGYPNDDDISLPKPEDPSNAFCQSGRNTGVLRGVFEGKTNGPDGKPITTFAQNPWPQLVRKMVQARTESQAPTAFEPSHPNGANFADEGMACHAPTPRYLGVLNCGKPTYWYYVAPERKSSYGLGCGQVGIQNSFPLNANGRRQMCLQEDNSCTPGYGIPKFTASNAPFFRTPCQELGDYIKSTMLKYDENGDVIPCQDDAVPIGLQIPGFEYVDGNYGDKTSYNQVPNTWVDGTGEGHFLYQEMLVSQQQNINVDMITYTDASFGGNVQSYAPGVLVEDPQDTNICVATANTQIGTLSMVVVNPSINARGTYAVTAVCNDPTTQSALSPQSNPNSVSVGGSATISGIDLGPTSNLTVSWSIYAIGDAPDLESSGSTDDPDSTGAPGNIGLFPTCTVTLRHGGGDNAELDKKTVECSVYALQVLVNDKVTVIDDVVVFRETCRDWILIMRPFCFFSNQGPYLTFMIIFLVVVAMVMMIWVTGLLARMYAGNLRLAPILNQFRQDQLANQQYKENRQALMMNRVLQAQPALAPPRAASSASQYEEPLVPKYAQV